MAIILESYMIPERGTITIQQQATLPPFQLIPIENAPSEYLPDDIDDVPILHWPDADDEPISLDNVTYYTYS